MKHRLVAILALSISASCFGQSSAAPRVEQTQAGAITRARIDGSLESRQNIGCIKIEDSKPTYTAVDLYAAVAACFKVDRFDDAANLFFLAGMSLRFDIDRLVDRSVGQAREVLVRRTLSTVPAEQSEKAMSALRSGMSDPKRLASICEAVDQVGPPTYFPEYLVLHGIAAFGKADPFKDALVQGFDGTAKWRELKDKYLHCPRS